MLATSLVWSAGMLAWRPVRDWRRIRNNRLRA
jgi:hypothetical protein